MLIMPSFKKTLIVEQFQGNYLKLILKTFRDPRYTATDDNQEEKTKKRIILFAKVKSYFIIFQPF